MDEIIRKYLQTYQYASITLMELEKLVPGDCCYQDFAQSIERLLNEEIIVPVKSHGHHLAYPSLPNKVKIKKQKLKIDLFEAIRSQQVGAHPLIRLDRYFSLTEKIWNEDQQSLVLLQQYLMTYGLPAEEVSVWERSFQIFGDEKRISEGAGKAFLQRVGIYDKLKIVDVTEPLMFAINPSRIHDAHCYHLIVENKTTFDALSEVVGGSQFLTLIYGAGKGFLNGIIGLEQQLNMPHVQHILFYFGDLDLEGIHIWHILNKRRKARLALPFYQQLLLKKYSIGKINQQKNTEAFNAFVATFSDAEQILIQHMFDAQGYYPQEALSAEELQQIWRSIVWKNI